MEKENADLLLKKSRKSIKHGKEEKKKRGGKKTCLREENTGTEKSTTLKRVTKESSQGKNSPIPSSKNRGEGNRERR